MPVYFADAESGLIYLRARRILVAVAAMLLLIGTAARRAGNGRERREA